jgi:hypothetical protein
MQILKTWGQANFYSISKGERWGIIMLSFFEKSQFLFLSQHYFTPILGENNVVNWLRNNFLNYNNMPEGHHIVCNLYFVISPAGVLLSLRAWISTKKTSAEENQSAHVAMPYLRDWISTANSLAVCKKMACRNTLSAGLEPRKPVNNDV